MDPSPPRPEAVYTAWHFFLAYCLEYVLDPARLQVRTFDRLGVLPLEADIILLRKVADLDGAARISDFDFLWPLLARYTVVEYKGPDDRLVVADLDKARAYGLLCKLKYNVRLDEDVRIVFLYSHVETAFFSESARGGMRFEDLEPGIRVCRAPAMKIVAVDLVALGERSPRNIINLLSARHHLFADLSPEDQLRADLAHYIFHGILSKEVRKMLDPEKLKGMQELTQDIEHIRKRFLHRLSVEERLEGLSLEERLQGLAPDERLQGLSLEERLQGLAPDELERLRALLDRRH